VKKLVIICILLTQLINAKDSYFYKNDEMVVLTPISSETRTFQSIDYYQNEKGILLGVKDTLFLKLQNNQNLQNYLNEFNLSMIKEMSENLYLLKTTDKSLTIDIANRLSEKEDVAYAHPDFIKKRVKR